MAAIELHRLKITGNGVTGSVELDGKPICVAGVDLSLNTGGRIIAMIDLIVGELDVDVEAAEVEVNKAPKAQEEIT